MGTFRFKRRFWSDLTLIYPIYHCGFTIPKFSWNLQTNAITSTKTVFFWEFILVRSIKLNLFISPVLGVDFCPFPSGYKYDICFNNIQSKLASSHSYCRSQLIQTIYLPLPPQQKTYSQSLIQYPSKYQCFNPRSTSSGNYRTYH